MLSFRWVARLPDWAEPIVWVLVVLSPIALAALLWPSGRTLLGGLAICSAFIAVGSAVGGLIHGKARKESRFSVAS